MSRKPFDAIAKDLTLAALQPLGSVESDVRLEGDPVFADLRFVPHPTPTAAPQLGLLAAMATERALFEFAHKAPDLAEIASWQRKQLLWFHALRLEAERNEAPLPSAPPLLWGLCGAPRRR